MRRVWGELAGKKISVSPFLQDRQVVLHGPSKTSKNPLMFARKLSIINLESGTMSGNCQPSEAVEVFVSAGNKEIVESMIARFAKS